MTELIEIAKLKLALAFFVVLAAAGIVSANAQARVSRAASQPSPDEAAFQQLNAGQVDQAAAAFQAILAVQPNDSGALAGMGQVRMLQGNYLGAVSFLERARQAAPNDAGVAAALDSARFSFLMGEGHDAQTAKDSEDAEKRYREALELRPGARQAVDALVNVLVAENRLSDAQDALSTAVAREAAATGQPPAELELQLAQLDIANNQPQLAYPIFLQILQDSPQRLDAWSGLISSLHLMGHDADAAAQEKAIPAATRVQLESAPGFQQMMSSIAASPAQTPSAGGPSFAPFVPSEAAPSSSAASASVATVPPAVTLHPPAPAVGNVRPPGVRSAPAQGTPKTVASSSQTTRARTETAQTGSPASAARSSSSSSGRPLVAQPASRPAARQEDIPDTGEQQYPQPRSRPRSAATTSQQ